MNAQPAATPAADSRHWRWSRRWAVVFTVVWALVWLGPLLLPGAAGFTLFGTPLLIWMCSLGAPIAFVLLVWGYERVLARLDRDREAGRAD